MTANPLAAARETLAAGTPTPWEVEPAASQLVVGETLIAQLYGCAPLDDARKAVLAVNIAEPALALAEAVYEEQAPLVEVHPEARGWSYKQIEQVKAAQKRFVRAALDRFVATLKEAQG